MPGRTSLASCAGVLAVGGIEPGGSLWRGSTREPYVAVAAPGDHMVYVGRDGRYTTTGAGTSFSAALTAAAAALIRSRYPHMPWYEVDQRLIDTATRVGRPVPNTGYGYGIVNLARAVNASAYPVRASAPDPVYARFRAWLATPAGRAAAARYKLGGPDPAAPAPVAGLTVAGGHDPRRDRGHRSGRRLRVRGRAGVRAQDVLPPPAARHDDRASASPQARTLGGRIVVVRPRKRAGSTAGRPGTAARPVTARPRCGPNHPPTGADGPALTGRTARAARARPRRGTG